MCTCNTHVYISIYIYIIETVYMYIIYTCKKKFHYQICNSSMKKNIVINTIFKQNTFSYTYTYTHIPCAGAWRTSSSFTSFWARSQIEHVLAYSDSSTLYHTLQHGEQVLHPHHLHSTCSRINIYTYYKLQAWRTSFASTSFSESMVK